MTDQIPNEPGTYLIPSLQSPLTPVPFDTAPTEIDPQSHPVCPVCGNWDIDCLCVGDS